MNRALPLEGRTQRTIRQFADFRCVSFAVNQAANRNVNQKTRLARVLFCAILWFVLPLNSAKHATHAYNLKRWAHEDSNLEPSDYETLRSSLSQFPADHYCDKAMVTLESVTAPAHNHGDAKSAIFFRDASISDTTSLSSRK